MGEIITSPGDPDYPWNSHRMTDPVPLGTLNPGRITANGTYQNAAFANGSSFVGDRATMLSDEDDTTFAHVVGAAGLSNPADFVWASVTVPDFPPEAYVPDARNRNHFFRSRIRYQISSQQFIFVMEWKNTVTAAPSGFNYTLNSGGSSATVETNQTIPFVGDSSYGNAPSPGGPARIVRFHRRITSQTAPIWFRLRGYLMEVTYRWETPWVPPETGEPPGTRLYPRDDGRGGLGGRRIYPPPASRRLVGGYQ